MTYSSFFSPYWRPFVVRFPFQGFCLFFLLSIVAYHEHRQLPCVQIDLGLEHMTLLCSTSAQLPIQVVHSMNHLHLYLFLLIISDSFVIMHEPNWLWLQNKLHIQLDDEKILCLLEKCINFCKDNCLIFHHIPE